jgi:Peptidase family M1 domain/Peptidase M1 N-terminal domain/ERAP1-like C-terminal domain
MSTTPNPYRLARTVVPSAYRIYLTPDLEAARFEGRVEIDVDIREPLHRVTLNAVELSLGAATLTTAATSYRSTGTVLDETYQTASFDFDDELPAGPATMEIAFRGVLNDLLHGFYRSTYVDDDGTSHTIATTQLQECDARRAFPCWDEPSFKATFQINLTVPEHLAAYSNSPVVADVNLGNGQRTVSYSPTMKMSTYLVAFVIGPFEETAPIEVAGTPLRVVYPKGQGHLTAYALDAASFALRFYTDYFDIAYPGEKLDLLAIPDFAFGAMENLGCVTFRQADLLIDPARASLVERQRVVTVVAHELAHMWFGDLVTMEWWEGIWLNEAFATFMQELCNFVYQPQWKGWVNFAVGVGAHSRDSALQLDGLHSTRPIELEVVAPKDSLAMVDELTYQKGGSVLRMLEQYLGADVFRDSIRRYLRRHSYANTVTTDLWDALEETSGLPVREMMNTWILQGGHPLVTLEDGELRQQPFAYGAARAESAIGSSWLVPVLTRSLSDGSTTRHLLGADPLKVTESAPVVVNAGGSGVFRSRYGTRELAAIAPRLGELDELERATLMADGLALLLSGRATWNDFYILASGLGAQDEPTSWVSVAGAVDEVYRALGEGQRPGFVGVIRELFDPQFDRLGWDARPGEDELANQLRGIIISTLGTRGRHEGIRAEAIRRFEADDLNGDLANAILRVVADQDRPGDFERFVERYRAAPTPQETLRYLRGLVHFNDEAVSLQAAELCLREVRTQDGAVYLGLISSNAVTGPAVWRYIAEHWDEAMEHFPAYLHSRLAYGLPTYITDETFAKEVEAFHLDHQLAGQEIKIEQQIERMYNGLAFTSTIRPQF